LPATRPGNHRGVVTLEVQPRQTPGERADTPVPVEIDENLSVNAEVIEEWVAPRQNWEWTLREGHDFGRVNNVEGRLLYVSGEQTSALSFRLDQLDGADDLGDVLLLRFEERDGIAKTVQLTANGLDIELFHILTYT
jgi:hypothetical protein